MIGQHGDSGQEDVTDPTRPYIMIGFGGIEDSLLKNQFDATGREDFFIFTPFICHSLGIVAAPTFVIIDKKQMKAKGEIGEMLMEMCSYLRFNYLYNCRLKKWSEIMNFTARNYDRSQRANVTNRHFWEYVMAVTGTYETIPSLKGITKLNKRSTCIMSWNFWSVPFQLGSKRSIWTMFKYCINRSRYVCEPPEDGKTAYIGSHTALMLTMRPGLHWPFTIPQIFNDVKNSRSRNHGGVHPTSLFGRHIGFQDALDWQNRDITSPHRDRYQLSPRIWKQDTGNLLTFDGSQK